MVRLPWRAVATPIVILTLQPGFVGFDRPLQARLDAREIIGVPSAFARGNVQPSLHSWTR